jgi:phosphoribosylaminoimidazole-succinocarboxamide synthase
LNAEENQPVYRTELPELPRIASGKVRDVYRLDGRRILIVATDRISAFDCILPDPIPRKGEVLTKLSVFWFEFLKPFVQSHFMTADLDWLPDELRRYEPLLAGRSTLVRAADMIPIECVARGYLAGSGWKEYEQSGTVCGIPLPPGLRDGDQLPKPIFTPAAKAKAGHDENISFEQVISMIGEDVARTLRALTLTIYGKAAEYARSRGILVADTKFEFGFIDVQLSLCDEVLTPDSSRFWPIDFWAPGGPQVSYDKQFVRNYLESLDWDKKPPAPSLPPNVIEQTSVKYVEAYRVLTGRDL